MEDTQLEEDEEEEGEADPRLLLPNSAWPTTLRSLRCPKWRRRRSSRPSSRPICSKVEVEANHLFLREAKAERDELFADMESDKEPEPWAAANEQEAGPSDTVGTEVVYISDDE